MARPKAAVADGVVAAPTLPALRNTLDDLLEAIVLIGCDRSPRDALSRVRNVDQLGNAPELKRDGGP